MLVWSRTWRTHTQNGRRPVANVTCTHTQCRKQCTHTHQSPWGWMCIVYGGGFRWLWGGWIFWRIRREEERPALPSHLPFCLLPFQWECVTGTTRHQWKIHQFRQANRPSFFPCPSWPAFVVRNHPLRIFPLLLFSLSLSLSLSHWEGFILRYSVNHVCVRGSDPYPLRHYKIENYARRGMRSVKNGMDWLRHREASGVCVLPATFVFSSCGTTNTHNHFQI